MRLGTGSFIEIEKRLNGKYLYMFSVESIIKQYDFNLAFAHKLVEDVSEEQMTIIPAKGLENHPAFTLGHLVSGSAMTVEDLGGDFIMPNGWKELFLRNGPGDPRAPSESNIYPTKTELLAELTAQHNEVKKYLLKATEEQLNKKLKWRFGSYMPTVLDVVLFMCVNHEAMHLSQLSAWRRAMGLPSALGNLK
jgi:hypothetical protein